MHAHLQYVTIEKFGTKKYNITFFPRIVLDAFVLPLDVLSDVGLPISPIERTKYIFSISGIRTVFSFQTLWIYT